MVFLVFGMFFGVFGIWDGLFHVFGIWDGLFGVLGIWDGVFIVFGILGWFVCCLVGVGVLCCQKENHGSAMEDMKVLTNNMQLLTITIGY